MSFLLDPTGSIYSVKSDTRPKPHWVADAQAIQALDANQIRNALLELRQGLIDVSGSSGAFFADTVYNLSHSYWGDTVGGDYTGLSGAFTDLSTSYYPVSASHVALSATVWGYVTASGTGTITDVGLTGAFVSASAAFSTRLTGLETTLYPITTPYTTSSLPMPVQGLYVLGTDPFGYPRVFRIQVKLGVLEAIPMYVP